MTLIELYAEITRYAMKHNQCDDEGNYYVTLEQLEHFFSARTQGNDQGTLEPGASSQPSN